MDAETPVTIVYPYLAHYREGVFLELERHLGARVSFVAGTPHATGVLAGIKTIDPGVLKTSVILRVRRIRSARWQQGLIRRAMRRDAGIVIMHFDINDLSMWLLVILRWMLRRPTFYWIIGWKHPESGPRKVAKALLFRMPQRILVYGEHARQVGIAEGFSGERIIPVGNSLAGCDGNWNSPGEVAEDGVPVVLAVMRLQYRKRLDLLIDAASILARRGTPIRVLIAGDGPEETRLRASASESAADVEFVGAVYAYKDLERLYSVAAMTVIPDYAGLTVIQSLHFGIPVVTHRSMEFHPPEAEAIAESSVCEGFERGSAESLADAIERQLHLNTHNPEHVRRECQRVVQERWNAQATARCIVSAIDQFEQRRK